ncbi:TPA: TonB family protein [Klebsiella oxytoca]|nr:TonB family protein [Klebsiella oxytoca]
MKKGFIGIIFLSSMLLGCTSPDRNSHPKLLYSPTPTYPYYAVVNKIEGNVRVRYNVGEDGKISRIWILRSEPQHLFDSAVIASMSKWRYETNTPSHGLIKTIYFKLQYAPN